MNTYIYISELLTLKENLSASNFLTMPNNRAFSLVSLSFLFAIFHVEGRLNGQNNQNTVFIIERPDDLTPSPFMNRNESIVS